MEAALLGETMVNDTKVVPLGLETCRGMFVDVKAFLVLEAAQVLVGSFPGLFGSELGKDLRRDELLGTLVAQQLNDSTDFNSSQELLLASWCTIGMVIERWPGMDKGRGEET